MTSRIRLIAGVVLALLTAVLLAVYTARIKASQTSEPFLRLGAEISVAQATTVPDSALETAYLPESAGSLVSIAVKDTPENREWLKGRRVSRDIAPGSLLLYEYFNDQPANRFAARIAPGKRAVSIDANASSAVSFLIEPGSRVDILGTLSLDEMRPRNPAATVDALAQKTSTQTILQNVRVLAVGNMTSRGAYEGSDEGNFGTVTIEVSPEEAEQLIFARANLKDGELTLLLRNPSDTKLVDLPRTDLSSAR